MRAALRPDKPPLAMMAAVCLACYISWRPSRDIMFTASDVLFLLGAWILIAGKRLPAAPMGGLTGTWFIAFSIMIAGLLLGSLASSDPGRWTIVAAQYGFAWIALPFLLVGHRRSYTVSLAKLLLAGVVAMELVGVIVFLSYQGSFEAARNQLGLDFISGSRRLGAFVTDANWNGAVVAMTLPFAFFLGAKGYVKPIWTILAVAILLPALLMTASFTAFVGAVLATAIFSAVSAIRPKLFVIVPVVAAAILAAQVGWLPSTFQKRVGTAIEQGDLSQAGTFNGRVALMEDAWKMAGNHLIMGVGVDQNRVVSKLHAPVHNMYLLLLVEGGLAAIGGWLVMMGVLLTIAIRTYAHDRLASALALSVLASFLIFSTASPHMYARLWAVPVLIAVAIARCFTSEIQPMAKWSLRRQLALDLRHADVAPEPAALASR